MEARYGELASLRYIEVDAGAAGQGADRPLIVGLHGRGSSPEDLAGLAPALDPRPRYVFPQAPISLDFGGFGAGWTWYEPIPGSPAVMAAARERLGIFLSALHRHFGTPPSRAALVGFSQGAVMTLDVGLRAPEAYAALVAMSGYLAEADDLAPALARAKEQPLLIVHGTRDGVLDVALARRMRRVVEDAGLSPEYYEFDMAHEVNIASLTVVRDFLARRLFADGDGAAAGGPR